jgi:hypothetical protein
MKFDTEHVIEALKETQINPDDIDAVVHKLEEIAEEIKKEKELNKTPRIKKKHILLNPKETASYYIMQCEQDYDLNQIVPALHKSIGDYNQTAKKKKVEIKNMAEAIEFIPNKILKDNGLNIKTKSPCEISTVDK